MPPRNAAGGDPPLDMEAVLLQMANNSAQLTAAVASLATLQASFMRSAADADANIGLSKSHSLLPVEVLSAKEVDSTVDDDNRSGLPAASRDLNPLPPDDYIGDSRATGYNAADPRHSNTYGPEHHEYTTERADALTAWRRTRGRGIRMLEKQLPADGYMNTFKDVAALKQWEGHPLTLTGSLNEGDVRKGEFTMSKFLNHHRWFTEYGKVYNAKQFMLNLSATYDEDLCNYASYDAYLTGSNKIFYLHEFFKSAVWKKVEASGFATDSTYQIPFRPASQLKLIHLTRMVNVTEEQHAAYALHADSSTHAPLRPGALDSAGPLLSNNTFIAGSPNAGIDAVWGREAALLPNNPVQPNFRNCGFKRKSVGTNVI